MLKTKYGLKSIAVAVPFMLLTSACATKKYVRQQVEPVSQKVAMVETQTNEKIGALSTKHETDISQVNERISTSDLKLSQTAAATQQAQSTASQALQQTETNSASIKANSVQISTLATDVEKALNYELVEKADVTFAFNKCSLTPEAKAALDQLASKILALPHAMVELAGFTDTIGSQNYNLALSVRRAEAVQRYLVMQNVPLRIMHVTGLGEETPPASLQADLSAVENPTKDDLNRLARRVRIHIFGAGEIGKVSTSASK